MISDAPLTVATNGWTSAFGKARAFIETATVAASNGLTWREFGELMVALLRLLTEAYDGVVTMTGEQKKAAVLDAVGQLFDALADKAVPTLAWPLWVIAKPAVRSLVLAIAAGAVEQVLPLVRGGA